LGNLLYMFIKTERLLMKKITFLIAITVVINALYGMEKGKEQKVRTFISTMIPRVVVVQDDIYERCTKNADITIFGEAEQIKLGNSELSMTPLIGNIRITHDNYIMKRNKIFTKYCDSSYESDDDSAAIKVEGERFIIKNPHVHVERKKMDNQFFFVKEPQLFFVPLQNNQSVDDRYIYERTLRQDGETFLKTCKYKGYVAINEALEDLGHCYKSVLSTVSLFFTKDHTARSIAIPQLSVGLGIPAYRAAQVAVAAVVEFIAKHGYKDSYGLIELVVHDSESFRLYQNLLIGHGLNKKEIVLG